MRHYIKVEMLRMMRNKRYIIFVVAFPVGFYLLYSNLWGAETDQSTGLRGSVLLMISMAAYGALASAIMSTAVPWSQERHSGWLRQLQITPLPGRAIILTKLISSMLLVLPALLLVGLAAVLTQDVSLPPGQWVGLILAMWIGTIPFAALGLTIGSLLPPDTAQPVAMIGMFALALLGGLWFPESLMPAVMKSIAHVTPSYDYASIGWQIAAGEAPHAADAAGILAWGVALVALAIFAYRRATVRA
ncbi:ABC transporter permease [Microbispora hainanensis]|jgi:ABC-2 type transport system permease protein|uniref:ABC transporter permease n=1 Tax=Microbispora hainanensis TaxID=568844 RepID=A0ABZ1SYT0_9ACTN|nr:MULTISPECIES: ABC transporter permease [Microbispora]NJP25155.1 ABC transporter permease [Microbispora sp. CL1-1]TQS14055.1 ABC transporter permease subunit [Microbispora sp. SCL1-1]